MFTANYYKALACVFTGRYAPFAYVNYAGDKVTAQSRTYTVNGAIALDNQDSNWCISMKRIGAVSGSRGIIFGTGDVEPTFNDYKLSGDIISSLTAAISTTYTDSDDGTTVTATCALTNTGSNAVTIKEVGLIGTHYGSTNAVDCILIDRAVLDEPVTIPAGGMGQVVYSITVKTPTV